MRDTTGKGLDDRRLCRRILTPMLGPKGAYFAFGEWQRMATELVGHLEDMDKQGHFTAIPAVFTTTLATQTTRIRHFRRFRRCLIVS